MRKVYDELRAGALTLNPNDMDTELPQKLTFLEELPKPAGGATCPPNGASRPTTQRVLRFSNSNPATVPDLASLRALNVPPIKGIDECKWSSCSVWQEDTPIDMLMKKRGQSKRLKQMAFLVSFAIDMRSGIIKIDNNHIDFWPLKDFDPGPTCKCEMEF